MVPDEPGQLAIARFVGRGQRWNMLDHSTWRPAYGVLLAPATWFTDDPAAVYRSGLVLNAVLGALSCVLLALLAARLTGRSRPTCAALAAAVSLAPALLFTTDWVWSEALVQVTLLLVPARRAAVPRRRPRCGGAPRWSSPRRPASHPQPAAAAGGDRRRAGRRRRVAAAACAGRAAVGLLALLASRWSPWLGSPAGSSSTDLGDPAATNTAGGVLDRLATPAPLAVGLGQLWYQLVASVGLAGLGAIALVRRAARGPRRRPASRPPSTPGSCWAPSLRWSRSRSCS